jgi:hypothetical protein
LIGKYLIAGGAAVQLIGLYVTFREVLALRVRFGRQPIVAAVRQVLGKVSAGVRRIFGRPRPVVVQLRSSMDSMSVVEGSATGRVRHKLEGVTDEAARKAIRAELDQIYRALDAAQDQLQKTVAGNRATADRDREEWQTQLSRLKGLLEETAIGAVRLRALGVFIIAFGVCVSAAGSWMTAATH